MIPQQCMHSKERLASSSIDKLTSKDYIVHERLYVYVEFPSKESRMRLQKMYVLHHKRPPFPLRCVNVHRVVCSFNIKVALETPTSILSMVLPSTGVDLWVVRLWTGLIIRARFRDHLYGSYLPGSRSKVPEDRRLAYVRR
ncbi:hypothetical protein EVAR_101072_1 [Eumeta japonica]|uniref:Uncharacterized protein n=1 Tax=Eumeta variegata TaxID=151549 RepID=A0A4C1SKM3_EUMVA|nr:hypothetical protein EVAR_101072_1 [Eumeta japonica]